ncbi:MAG: LysR family transcriptional regulator [Gammaproteobacteria bacterium]|nr:LysR family transcriptional regulator [Gammaproteobacteria bacterium]MBV9315827.1 LysR family transcriptional regulator [Gammaproteobacteria bacterium]MBV9725333.1 LysR family transcriptional regulator [Gammaproteobacteria bacterium]
MTKAAIRFRVELGPEGAFGPGKIELLEHIGRGGSLSQAARELGMSYRRAWQLLDSLNHCFRERVAVTAQGGRRGGGATLTAFGRELIRTYRDFDAEVQARAARHFRLILREARSGGATRKAARVVRLSNR